MQKIFLSFLGLIVSSILFCQSPLSINYQAVLRNSDGTVKGNETVEVVVNILSGSIEGEVVFSETHNTPVHESGIVNLQIGSISPLDAILFTTDESLFLNITVDGFDMGTSQLLSVPYALVSEKSFSLAGTDGIGEGSRLDADLLDGKDSQEFALSSHTHTSEDASDLATNRWRGGSNNPWNQIELSLHTLRSDLDSLQEMLKIIQGVVDNRNNHEIKQLRIDFRFAGTMAITQSTAGSIYHELQYFDFNIGNYKKYQSIKFAAYIASHDPNNTCYLELYNLTDSAIIPNSTISNDAVNFRWVESQNLINDFPEKDIDLTIRLRSENSGKFASLQSAHLYVSFVD